jgi:nucleoside-diphosphate-sugar epimerase
VSPARSAVRSRRTGLPVVAVTGAAGSIGGPLVQLLAQHEGVRRVVALDDHRGDVEGVTWRILDVRNPILAERLAGVDVVVHVDIDLSVEVDPEARTSRNVRGTQTVLTAAAAAGVTRVVLLSSAMVYGAHADNLVPLPEDSPLRASSEIGLLADLLEIERLGAVAPHTHPGMSVTMVRPAIVVGAGADTLLTRHFEAPRLLVLRGSRPRWQFCHLDDLVSALACAAVGQVTGVVTVGSDGWLEQDDLERISGLHRIELPASVAFGAAERLHRLGILPAPAAEMSYVVHPWVVSTRQLRHSNWRATHDNEDCLRTLLAEVAGRHAVASRRVGRRDATLGAAGAAGAAVAFAGTAALVRRARRRRRG